MLPGISPQSGSAAEKRLRKLFREMSQQDQAALLRFAEYLVASPTAVTEVMRDFPLPEQIERPAQESVVKAIKRLVATYPMIERDRLLNETSNLMSAHVIQGKPAVEVIDALEALFHRHYQELKAAFETKTI